MGFDYFESVVLIFMKYAILLAVMFFTIGCDKKIHEAKAPSRAPQNSLTLNAQPALSPPA